MEKTGLKKKVIKFFSEEEKNKEEILSFLEEMREEGVLKSKPLIGFYNIKRLYLSEVEKGIFKLLPSLVEVEKEESNEKEEKLPDLSKNILLERIKRMVDFQINSGKGLISFKEIKSEVLRDDEALVNSQVIESWLNSLGKVYPEFKEIIIPSLDDKRERGIMFKDPENILKICKVYLGEYTKKLYSLPIYFKMEESDSLAFVKRWGFEGKVLMVQEGSSIIEIEYKDLKELKNISKSLRPGEKILNSKIQEELDKI